MESRFVQATAQEWKRLGIDPAGKEIARAARVFLGYGQDLVRQGLDVNRGPGQQWQDSGSDVPSPRGLFAVWEDVRFKEIWPPIEKRITERIKRRFGEDGVVEVAYYPGGWDKETGRVRSLGEAARQTLARSRAASLQWRRLTLSAKVARFLRELRNKGAEISEQAFEQELARVKRMKGRELASLSDERIEEEITRRFPVPEARPLSGLLPAPLSPVERLAWRVGRAAEQGPAVLWIRTTAQAGLQGVRWRFQRTAVDFSERPSDHPDTFHVLQQDLKALDSALGQQGWRKVNVAYRIEVPAETSALAVSSFLKNVNWWAYPENPGKSRRRIVQVPWPIALPGPIPSLPPAGEVSSGLEEVLSYSEIGSSV